ncbi:MAG: hypothetical protein K0R11_1741 [Acidimicrobiales bacterium]|nr:hypothetical protein [Acidimicrobiales bacterium]
MTAVLRVFALTISWDPTIRGYLVVATGVAVLCGSVYLLLATNTGNRLGFLIAAAGLAGWMTIMGLVWWLYGIGWVGEDATWQVREVVVSEQPEDTSGAATEEARDLSDWEDLPEGGGDAAAAADEALTGEESTLATFESTQDYTLIAAKETGGKDPDSLLSELPGPHPHHFAVVQVRPVVDVEVPFGETPPAPEADPDAQVFTVVMERDLGTKRLVPAAFTIVSAIFFGVTANVLHRRDKAATEARARAAAG